MSDQFLGEIRLFPFGYTTSGWLPCSGQLLPIRQYTALYSVLGIMYGGDGRVTFALPDLNGRAPVSAGQGPGLSPYFQGDASGSATVELQSTEMPLHNHTLQGTRDPGDTQLPSPDTIFARGNPGRPYGTDPNANRVQMAPQSLAPAGSGQAHNNMPPSLAMNFCIALQGVFPQRP